MQWIQDNFDDKKHLAALIKKEISDDETINLMMCFLDFDKKPLIEFDDVMMRVITNKLDQDFIEKFDDQDSIIIEIYKIYSAKDYFISH